MQVFAESYPELMRRQQQQAGSRRAAPEPKVYELAARGPQRDARTPHTTNFFSCVRSRKQPNAHAELGYQIIAAIKLGVYAYLESKIKLFDPKTQRIVDKAPPRPMFEGDGKNRTVDAQANIS